ncbi:DUF2309 domain-containing protein [Leeuwenhoekiella sp. MAR_2009_132]|uniref:DUF2309 domain-containing protein n=1 Tax=Leeuwenhoekiella sp. MAR_2009_132 TaxID=1392489 RepID=UPI00048ACFDC|nr:DUF2309 domain-containing protein [Leeuwenhoekiella sp. MAR_2009_132]
MITQNIQKSISEASQVIGKTWPLYSFVTSNPLSGYERLPFKEAVQQAKGFLNAQVFPETSIFRHAWKTGEIDHKELKQLLAENGLLKSPEFYLDLLSAQKQVEIKNTAHKIDRIMAQWLSTFLDEGLAEWEMPGKEEGFYNVWRKLAKYDAELKIKNAQEIPHTAAEALTLVLKDFTEAEITSLFKYHLAALPGWTGFINYRTASNSTWQQAYPITLEEYLAVRLFICKKLNLSLLPPKSVMPRENSIGQIQYLWLKAWEKSWQNKLATALAKNKLNTTEKEFNSPEAQLVFCIDTRSELIRRHVESTGNYETFGYAGFFGIAMDYNTANDTNSRKSCPPIVPSAYVVTEAAQANKGNQHLAHSKKNENLKFANYFLKRMKNMLPSAFGFVEGSGFFYGMSLIARTLKPGYLYRIKQKKNTTYEHIYEPQIHHSHSKEAANSELSLSEKVSIVKSAFDLMGWKHFAQVVLFVGHGSHSANNPFSSSLDCGACAASPGRHNARMLAKLANLREVREVLKENHQFNIPDSTVFIGAEHNTTTDEIVIFDSLIPESHHIKLDEIKSNLKAAQLTATRERLHVTEDSIFLAQDKANNWGETRPEWGLAKNAGFIVAPRKLTKNINLDSRYFLHSYDWETDTTGKALEGIMQGPMVVTQWINNHYYFSTVDNKNFGGGTKITHNITGHFGVVQGNGGDLKMGLPLQSVSLSDNETYHQPLRLSVLIKAPLERVNDIISRNQHLQTLVDNEWIYLLVMNPLKNNKIERYTAGLNWKNLSKEETTKESSLTEEALEEMAF